MTPARITPPTSAPAVLALCRPYLKNHPQDVILAAAVRHPADKKGSRDSILLWSATGHRTYILTPAGSIRTCELTPALFRAAREYHNLSQAELGARLGLIEDTIANKENGRTKITHRDVTALALALKS